MATNAWRLKAGFRFGLCWPCGDCRRSAWNESEERRGNVLSNGAVRGSGPENLAFSVDDDKGTPFPLCAARILRTHQRLFCIYKRDTSSYLYIYILIPQVNKPQQEQSNQFDQRTYQRHGALSNRTIINPTSHHHRHVWTPAPWNHHLRKRHNL